MYTELELNQAVVDFAESYPESIITSMHYNIINPKYIWATHIHDFISSVDKENNIATNVLEIYPIVVDKLITTRGIRSIELSSLILSIKDGSIGDMCRLGLTQSGFMEDDLFLEIKKLLIKTIDKNFIEKYVRILKNEKVVLHSYFLQLKEKSSSQKSKEDMRTGFSYIKKRIWNLYMYSGLIKTLLTDSHNPIINPTQLIDIVCPSLKLDLFSFDRHITSFIRQTAKVRDYKNKEVFFKRATDLIKELQKAMT